MADISVDEDTYEDMRQAVYDANSKLRAEQREHGITTRQRDALQTQCEDMQSEMEAELKINNAALNPSAKVLQQDQEDEIPALKHEIADLQGAVANAKDMRDSYKRTALILSDNRVALEQKIEALKLVDVALRTDVSKLAGYKVELESSAETQALHMQQVDAACKAAEAKVIEQRKEIEELKGSDDLWICPAADGCVVLCDHKEPHKKTSQCQRKCRLLDAPRPPCVKVNTCKECANIRDEIINRDAVILEQERKAYRTDEIMRTAFEQLNKLRGCVEKRNAVTEKHNSYIVMLSCKVGDMQTPETKHSCKWYNVCAIASETSHACTSNEGQHCGRRREIDAAHLVKL